MFILKMFILSFDNQELLLTCIIHEFSMLRYVRSTALRLPMSTLKRELQTMSSLLLTGCYCCLYLKRRFMNNAG